MSLANNDGNHDPIASVYNAIGVTSEAESIALILEQLMLKHLSKGTHILDIGCANGQLVQQFHIRGYQTTGLDCSEKLLHHAQINAPESKFILSDIRNFESLPTYDAVFSRNTLGFILNLEELTTVFRNVYAAMHNNGIFVFAIVTGDSVLRDSFLQDYNICDVNDKYVYVEKGKYNPEERIRELKSTTFELINGIWERSDSTLLEKNYFSSEIQSALENVGFIEINQYDSKDFGDPTPAGEDCFVCRKPSLTP
ncbi:class I SAM-dependent DNA methyltransferase [uncultured Nostoc sp.]|uniref:class I SAM-dependent DNA methyltransferase n=1 Tax=uncultured Nostoc sp. TaxID=340711 RepID=UPI0035C9B725